MYRWVWVRARSSVPQLGTTAEEDSVEPNSAILFFLAAAKYILHYTYLPNYYISIFYNFFFYSNCHCKGIYTYLILFQPIDICGDDSIRTNIIKSNYDMIQLDWCA